MRPTLIADERECAGYLAYPLGVHAKSHVLERITQVASTARSEQLVANDLALITLAVILLYW